MPYKDKEFARRKAKERYIMKHDILMAYNKQYYKAHKEKIRADVKTWYLNNRDKLKDATHKAAKVRYKLKHRLKKEYGLTPQQHSQMLVTRQGHCDICGCVPKKLMIDHNHQTGKVRGLLCSLCNFLLGSAKDSPLILAKAIEYLKEDCMKINLLQFGNRKLPRSTGIFNLPRIKTCPGRTSYCMQHCYAQKAEIQYPSAAAYREKMYLMTTAQNFVQVMIDTIKNKKVAGAALATIRIHESGDAYSQEYLNKWLEIATALPLVTFYMYTKSFMLDFSKRPKNLIVRGSVDPSSKQLEIDAALKLDGVAETRDGKQAAIVPDAKECPGSCKTCDYCLKPGNVWFKLH